MKRQSSPASNDAAPVGLIVLLTALVMVGQMSTSLYLPSLPSVAAALDADASLVKLTMTVFLGAFAVAQLILGPLSDRIGRRPALFIGLALYLFGTATCMLAPSIEVLIAGRFVQGFGACAGPAIARAIVRDRYERAEAARVLAYIGIAMAVGPAVGPIIGGQLQVLFGWRANFLALIGFGAVVWAATLLSLGESLARSDPLALAPAHLARNYGRLLRSRAYWGHMLVIAFIFGGMFAYATGLPFVLIDLLGMSPDAFGRVFIATVVGSVAGSAIASRAAARVAGETMVAIGAGVAMLGGLLMLCAVLFDTVSPLTIVGAMMVFQVGFGIAAPNCLSGAMAPFPSTAGAASAMVGFAQMAMAALGSIAVALLYGETALPMAAAVFIMGAAAALSYVALVHRAGPDPHRHS